MYYANKAYGSLIKSLFEVAICDLNHYGSNITFGFNED
jgi:hypothetical protein